MHQVCMIQGPCCCRGEVWWVPTTREGRFLAMHDQMTCSYVLCRCFCQPSQARYTSMQVAHVSATLNNPVAFPVQLSFQETCGCAQINQLLARNGGICLNRTTCLPYYVHGCSTNIIRSTLYLLDCQVDPCILFCLLDFYDL